MSVDLMAGDLLTIDSQSLSPRQDGNWVSIWVRLVELLRCPFNQIGLRRDGALVELSERERGLSHRRLTLGMLDVLTIECCSQRPRRCGIG